MMCVSIDKRRLRDASGNHMKITFVQSENESLAVEYFSALLKSSGHSVDLAYDNRYFARTAVRVPALARALDIREMLVEQIVGGAPDLVGFSVMTSGYQWALDMAHRIKRVCDVPIIFGGVHVSSVPELVISEEVVDLVCVGEGERSLLSLTDEFARYPDLVIPGIWIKSDGEIRRSETAQLIPDLDALPFPDKSLFYEKLPWLSRGYLIMTSRGCPYNCTFCSNDMLRRLFKGKGRYVRRRSVQNVIEEMTLAKERFGPSRFNILDDCFTADKAWLREFCARYEKDVSVPFIAVSHPTMVDDEVAAMLAGARCAILLLGVQSTSEATRKETLNRKETNEQIRDAAAACHRHGLKLSIDHIFGIPGEGVEDYRRALSFYNEIRPDTINTYWLVYFPKTTIIEHALDAGILDQSDVDLINHGELDIAMNVGIGSEGRKKSNEFFNYAFLFSLIPFLPKRAVGFLIKRGMYLDNRHPPIALTLTLRVFSLIKLGLWKVYWETAFGILIGFLRVAFLMAKRRAIRSIGAE